MTTKRAADCGHGKSRPNWPANTCLITRRKCALYGTHLKSVPEFCSQHQVIGHKTQRIANTTNITFHGIESEALLILLDKEGICASSGSACLADSDEPSHVIKAMKPNSAASRHMIRFSLDTENPASTTKTVLAILQEAVLALQF